VRLRDGFVFEWIRSSPSGWREVLTLAEADGVCFACPLCTKAGNPHAVVLFFEGVPQAPHLVGPGRWRVTAGTTADDLSLQPSVHLQGGCGWHGWVTAGAAA